MTTKLLEKPKAIEIIRTDDSGETDDPLATATVASPIISEKTLKILRPVKQPHVTWSDGRDLDVLGLTDEDILSITAGGYEPQRIIGKGSNRVAILATRKFGNLEREYTIKIPVKEEQIVSPTAIINTHKRNVNLNEVQRARVLSHPNISYFVESRTLPSGRVANYEDYEPGRDLESILTSGQTFTVGKTQDVMRQILEGMEYAHKKGIVHRDLTPGNILITDSGKIKITDWQNAGERHKFESSAMPTRGGTRHTPPELLNALMLGERESSGERTDLYGLGTTFYYLLTGKHAFNYSLTLDPNGKEIEIGDEKIRVALKDGNKVIDKIDKREHEKKLKQALQEVPRQYRTLLHNLMTTGKRKGKPLNGYSYDISDVKRDFEKACRPALEERVERAWKWLKVAGTTAFVGGAVAYLCVKAAYSPVEDLNRGPTLSEVIYGQERIEKVIDKASPPPEIAGVERKDGPNKGEDFVKKYLARQDAIEKRTKEIMSYADLGFQPRREDRRLVSAYVRSLLMGSEEKVNSLDKRTTESKVPLTWFELRGFFGGIDMKDKEAVAKEIARIETYDIQWRSIKDYVQGAYRHGDSAAEVYSKSMFSQAEIDSARREAYRAQVLQEAFSKKAAISGGFVEIKELNEILKQTGDVKYMARVVRVPQEKPFLLRVGNSANPSSENYTQEVTIRGYREYLDPARREIVDRAIFFYMMTDAEGKINLQNFRDNPISPSARPN